VRTVYVDRRDAELAVEGGALVVRANRERVQSLPLGTLERVVVRAPAVMSAGLLAELWRRDVGLLVLSGRYGEPTARLLGTPARDAGLRLAQARLLGRPVQRSRLAAMVLAAKLAGQKRLLTRLRDAGTGERRLVLAALERVAAQAAKIDPGAGIPALIGHEGAASAAYFEAFRSAFAPSLGFRERNRRPPRDPVNVCLSLGYTLLHHEAACAAQLVGLDPMIGILHEPAAGRASLACDLVEPLRSHVDGFVQALFADGKLRAAHFALDGDACRLGKAGREAFYRAWEDGPAAALARLSRRGARAIAGALLGDSSEGPES
jgi:CRISPR-associated protein Cas1